MGLSPEALLALTALAGLALGVLLRSHFGGGRGEAVREENMKVLCWLSQSGKLKIDEEGNKAPRLLRVPT